MIDLAQDLIVTAVVASAVVVVGRRVFGAIRPAKGQDTPACPSCAAGNACAAKPAHKSSDSVHPLPLVR